MICSKVKRCSKFKRQDSGQKQKGSALIVVLLLVAILSSLVIEFAYEVYIDSSALSNWANAQKASLIAESGQTLGAKLISMIGNESYTYEQRVELPVMYNFGSGTGLVISIEDENSKININSLIYANGLTNEKAMSSLKKLFESLNINPDIVSMIADWIDPDNESRLIGSESDAGNRLFWSEEELKLVRGIDEKTYKVIIPYITIYGDNQININTAKTPVLVSLHKDMTEDLAKRVVSYRESNPFEDSSHIQRVSGMEIIGQYLIGKVSVKSSTFRVVSTAVVTEISRVVESVVDTSLKVHFWREI